jgi:MFS family permease
MASTSPAPHPFSIPDYRTYWVARFVMSMATLSMVVVIGWQVYDIARTDYGMSLKEAAFQLGLIGLCQFAPQALLSPVAGWAADRFERRTVAICANSVDIGVALALATLTASDALNLPLLFILAASHGMARVFSGPALSSIAPNIVPEASLPRAIALSSIAWQSAAVFGPAMGGLLYAAHSSSAYWVAAALLAISCLCIATIQPVHPPMTAKRQHPVRLMIEGLRYCRDDRFLFGAITLDLFAVLLGGATALLPVYARDILHVGPDGLGQLRAAMALGAAVIGIYLVARPMQDNVGVKMLWSVVVFGLAIVGFGWCDAIGAALFGDTKIGTLNMGGPMAIALIMLAIAGGADMLSVFVRNSLVQLNTPDAMRGRVSSVSGLAISASNELGELQSGFAAALLGPVGAVVFGGFGAIFVTGIWAFLFPELKNARTFEQRNNVDPQPKEAES